MTQVPIAAMRDTAGVRLAVIGATGFIGTHVLASAKAMAIDVVAASRTRNKWCGIGKFVEIDVGAPTRDPYAVLGQPDAVLHLAWGGLPNYLANHHFEEELPKQYAFLKRLIESGLKRLTVVGTCFEYGMQSGPLSESLQTQPVTSYGFAKDALRQQLEYLAAQHGTELTWARMFYLWGDGQAQSSIYAQLSAALSRGDQTFKMSLGEQLRDFLPIGDAADYLVRLACHPKGVGVLNVCSGKPISIRRLVETWYEDSGKEIELELGYYPYPEYEPMAFWGNAQKLHSIFSPNGH